MTRKKREKGQISTEANRMVRMGKNHGMALNRVTGKEKGRAAQFFSDMHPATFGPKASGRTHGGTIDARVEKRTKWQASQIAKMLPEATKEARTKAPKRVKGICNFCGDAGRHVDPETRACMDAEACEDRRATWS